MTVYGTDENFTECPEQIRMTGFMKLTRSK